MAKQYFKLTGKPSKHKVISRAVAYHGTTQGALSITGVPALKEAFEPLVPGRAPGAQHQHLPGAVFGDDPKAFGRWAADQIEQAILFEGPDTVAAVFLEPVQNAGGCFPPPPGYFERVREICDEHDVLLVSDEVICAFGRLGATFACDKFDYVPDMITCAKGMTSGYSPIGAMIASDRVMEPFLGRAATLPARLHLRRPPGVLARSRWPTWTSSSARGSTSTCWTTRAPSARTLEKLLDLPIVGDVRGDGFFYGIELVKDKATKETFDDDESERLLRGFLSDGAVRRRPVLPRRRPRRPGRPARPAADLRPGRSSTRWSRSCAAS